MPKNTFRLGAHDASHYVALFDENQIAIQPAIGGPRATPEIGVATIGEGDLEFELWLPSIGGKVTPESIETARSVLSQIVQMDDEARAIPDTIAIEHDESLAWVAIHEHSVEFHYFANTVNSEWSVYFTREADAWHCHGFQQPL